MWRNSFIDDLESHIADFGDLVLLHKEDFYSPVRGEKIWQLGRRVNDHIHFLIIREDWEFITQTEHIKVEINVPK